ncbi:ABC transporter permease subunit [Halomarina salina]|uniref:ABC transporter permease subunit n=1 Tax=Halomarina salina TaxID=1872699 RepID=A0ABD5RKJ2_9EURY
MADTTSSSTDADATGTSTAAANDTARSTVDTAPTDTAPRAGSLAVLVRRSAVDPIRSGTGYVTVVLFLLVAGLFAYTQAGRGEVGFSSIVAVVTQVAPFLVVVRCADVLAADRESGRLRGLLALPFSRRQVVVGTLLGRLAWFVAAALGSLAVALVVFSIRGGTVDLGATLVSLALLCVVLAVYVGVAVGVSAAVPTTTRAVVAASGVWLVTQLFWSTLPGLVTYLLNGFEGAGEPAWADTFVALGPFDAYQTLATAFVQGGDVPPVLGGEPWSALLVLLVWFAAPLLLGLRRFERASL